MQSLDIPGPLGRRPKRIRAARVRQFATAWVLIEETVRRLVDFFAALVLIVTLSPLLLLRGLYAKADTGQVFERTPAVGIFRTRFDRLSFAGPALGRSLALLVSVLKGDMSFIGPRPLTPTEATSVPVGQLERFWIRPGLVSAYWLRKSIGVAYEPEYQIDRDFFYAESLAGDLGLMARVLPNAVLAKRDVTSVAPFLRFFRVDIANTSMQESLDWIVRRTRLMQRSQICFVNPDCLNIAYTNSEYLNVLRRADLVLPDGIGIHLAGRIKGTPMLENVNGTDLFPRLCERAAAERLPLYLLGARPSVVAAVAEAMGAKYPRLEIAGTHHGYFDLQHTSTVVDDINTSGAQILLVAMGAPRQDLWLAGHRDELRTPTLMGVGGLFDFYSGNIRRAPMWMRELGLEWVWRLLQEPGRMWRRYLIGNPLFLFRVWKESANRAESLERSY
jgi:N-acetylglucosaminyldiphosphoundecaprenol N-acetyl-beta-D-mannosaminyltransferase